MIHKVLIFIFKILPKGFISRILGILARVQLPGFLIAYIIDRYCGLYKVNCDEFLFPDGGFKSIDQFFTRKLKPGVHKIDREKNSVLSPVDARIDQFGKITRGRIIQAKGMDYGVNDLVPSAMAENFRDGLFITLYLSPADYHRIHSPVSGKITGYFNIPGKLFPVKELLVNGISGLFSGNERILSYIETGIGHIAVCKIGAMNVGRISLAYDNVISNKFFRKRKEFFYSKNEQPLIKKGDEIGVFHLGSTVILLFQKGMLEFGKIRTGQKVRVGQRIAALK